MTKIWLRFESFFCQPGLKGAHEKGGVEGEIGRFRRLHLVPVPNAATLAELNEHIAAGDVADDSRVITGRPVGAVVDVTHGPVRASTSLNGRRTV